MAWRTARQVAPIVVRPSVRTARRTQNPCARSRVPATRRARARPHATRTAFWNHTERCVALPMMRRAHSCVVGRSAYQKSSLGRRGEVLRPATETPTAVTAIHVDSASVSSVACRRRTSVSTPDSPGSAARRIRSAWNCRIALSSASAVGGRSPARRAAPMSSHVRATRSRSAAADGSVRGAAPGGTDVALRDASWSTTRRTAAPACARARSRRPGPVGRSPGETCDSRSPSLRSRSLATETRAGSAAAAAAVSSASASTIR